jgi:hypothetical protein
MAWRRTRAQARVASDRLNWEGGGDPDVTTKSGRTTRVSLEVGNIRPSDDWRSVLVDVDYSVREMASNFTFLRWQSTASLPIPEDARRENVHVVDVRAFTHSWHVRGKVHDWLSLDNVATVEGTPIERGGQYRIDGPGDDERNAGIRLELSVPVIYDDTSPPI